MADITGNGRDHSRDTMPALLGGLDEIPQIWTHGLAGQ